MEYYELLLNECRYLRIDYERLHRMKATFKIQELTNTNKKEPSSHTGQSI